MCYSGSHEEIEDRTWCWFRCARNQTIPISGPKIQEKARDYARQLNDVSDFRASNGWIDRFETRHNIGASKLSGERASVDSATVDSWRERLAELTRDYEARDIYNIDETGLFF